MKKIEFVPIFLDLETTGDNMLEDRIVAVGYKIGGYKQILLCKTEEEELNAIATALQDIIPKSENMFADGRVPLLVGYNINFDLSFIACRSAILAAKKVGAPTQRIQVMEHSGMLRDLFRVDLMYVVSRYWLNGSRKGLKAVCKAIGVEFDDVDGSEVPKLVEEGKWDEIKKHLKCDLIRLEKLFEVLNMQNLIAHNIQVRYNLQDCIVVV